MEIPARLAFTKRFLVVEDGVTIAGRIFTTRQNPQFFQTHQKIQFTVNTRALNLVNPLQQIKVDYASELTGGTMPFILNQPSLFIQGTIFNTTMMT